MATTVSRTVDFINHDPWDYLYQYGSEVSSDIYNYEDFEQFLYEDMEEEFEEWLNEEYSASKLLYAMRDYKYGNDEFYFDLLNDWVSHVLNNAEKYGWYFILEEDDEDDEE